MANPTSIRFDEEKLARVKQAAADAGETIGQWVNTAVDLRLGVVEAARVAHPTNPPKPLSRPPLMPVKQPHVMDCKCLMCQP